MQRQDLGNILSEVEAFVDAQPEREVEKRCISQLLNEPYEFTDPGSQVTTKTLIALSWLAIHDDNERTGDLKDAEDKFLEALYDINRAYNLSVNFEDKGGADRKACAAGTFNKFIEKLVGIHSDAEQEYITHKTAYLKSKPIILEEANGYLETLTPEALQALGVNELKAAIQPIVIERILFEFAELYQPDKYEALAALLSPYNTFDELKASEHYEPFKLLIKDTQNDSLERLIRFTFEEETEIDFKQLIEAKLKPLAAQDASQADLSAAEEAPSMHTQTGHRFFDEKPTERPNATSSFDSKGRPPSK